MKVGDKINVDGAVVRKVRDAQPAGEYRPTSIDTQKAVVAFRLTAVGKKNTIVWASGTTELVTDAQLTRLQAAYTWATDF